MAEDPIAIWAMPNIWAVPWQCPMPIPNANGQCHGRGKSLNPKSVWKVTKSLEYGSGRVTEYVIKGPETRKHQSPLNTTGGESLNTCLKDVFRKSKTTKSLNNVENPPFL